MLEGLSRLESSASISSWHNKEVRSLVERETVEAPVWRAFSSSDLKFYMLNYKDDFSWQLK